MAKFAKIIDVKDVDGIEQILLFVHQNENDLYVVSAMTQLKICELKLTIDFQPVNDNDDCERVAMEVFDEFSNAPEQVIIEWITGSDAYKAVVGYRND